MGAAEKEAPCNLENNRERITGVNKLPLSLRPRFRYAQNALRYAPIGGESGRRIKKPGIQSGEIRPYFLLPVKQSM